MESNPQPDSWTEALANFLRTQPAVSAVRIDPTAHKVSVATIGNVDVRELEEKLAATIAAVEEQLAARSQANAPAGFALKREGQATIIGKKMGSTAEKMWLWREMEWPEVRADETPDEQEWKTL
ncbi:MAG TPA: cation-transporting P-type ATPase, partial [Opitutaceae bacterium]|nr:cation-transporting P-type ATPase [Opitutaceae bacterium]